jgi:hypothetical protein
LDDQDDRGYSRAPQLEGLLSLCKALNAEGVRYVLIGGFAVILHGFVRATKEIDLLVDASVENVQRLKRICPACRTTPSPSSPTTKSRSAGWSGSRTRS